MVAKSLLDADSAELPPLLTVRDIWEAIAAQVTALTGSPVDELVTIWRREVTRAIFNGELRALMPDSYVPLSPDAPYLPVASQIAVVAPAVANEWLRARGVPLSIDPDPPLDRWPEIAETVAILGPCTRPDVGRKGLRDRLDDLRHRPELEKCRKWDDRRRRYRWHPVRVAHWLADHDFLLSMNDAMRAIVDSCPAFAPPMHRAPPSDGPAWCPLPMQSSPTGE